MTSAAAKLRHSLLAWYDGNGRSLPWRTAPDAVADPYRTWVSEFMLQQTTVAAVVPYYERFVARWPTVQALAAARLDDVLGVWQGLGYYARARNLHATARIITTDRGGRFPDTVEGLRELPGIGAYTAAAIGAIAFSRAAVAIDGNVRRVLARMFALDGPALATEPRLVRIAARFAAADRPGDFVQALMELGATLCAPRTPDCAACPWQRSCRARRLGRPESYPAPKRRTPRPTRHGVAFWLERADGAVLFRRRPESGLLGGLMEVPSTPWRATPWRADSARKVAPLAVEWKRLPGAVRHGFTHFDLALVVMVGRTEDGRRLDGLWRRPGRLSDLALPNLVKKIVRHAGNDATDGPGTTGRKRSATRTGRRAWRGH